MFVRIQNRLPKINIRVSTGLEVDVREWNKSLTSARALTAFRNGKGKDLFIKLDAIMCMIDSFISEGIALTSDLVKERIHEIVFAETDQGRKGTARSGIKKDKRGCIYFH